MSAKSDAAAAAREDQTTAKAAHDPRAAEKQEAEAKVFGADDPLKERGIGSPYQNAAREDKIRLAALESREAADAVAALGKSMIDALARLDAAHTELANVSKV